jgi:hypothetical protein
LITDVTWKENAPHPPTPSPCKEKGSQSFFFPLSFARRGARRCPEPVEGGEVFKSFHVTSVINFRIIYNFISLRFLLCQYSQSIAKQS